MDTQLLQNTIHQIENLSTSAFSQKAFVGLDGFIDFIQRAVKLQGSDGPLFFETLEQFGQHIAKAAGKSAQIELQTQATKLGGNAPIMSESMACLGFETVCLGNFGAESTNKVFQSIHSRVQLVSIGDAAITNALEFDDGKLILSEVSPFKNLDWEYVRKNTDIESLAGFITNASLVALVDWCNLPHSTSIWQGILEDIMPKLTNRSKPIFFDLADPSRRTDDEIMSALELIGQFNQYGNVTLGLNENETEQLYATIQRTKGRESKGKKSRIEMGKYLFDHVDVDNLLIHPTKLSMLINKDGVIELPGRFVPHPKISTGGGDNFNAGFCAGQLLGFDVKSSMILGMATSGFYVENGRSGSIKDISNYLSNWINEQD